MSKCTQMISMNSRATRGKQRTDILVILSSLELITNLHSRFEEIKDDEPVKDKKRARESDGADTKSPAEKKNKKQKTDGAKVVAVDATEGKEKKGKKKKNAEEKTVKLASDGTEKKEAKASTITGGIVIEDAKTGTGPQAKKGNTVRMRYVGKLTNGKVFDKNTAGKPVRYHPSSHP